MALDIAISVVQLLVALGGLTVAIKLVLVELKNGNGNGGT